jgi:hypothetical protein
LKLFKQKKIPKDQSKQISMVKKILKKIPEDKRHLVAATMWRGTTVKHMPITLLPVKHIIKDANNHSPHKEWSKLKSECEKFLNGHYDEEWFGYFKNKLLNKTYKKEPELREKLVDFFECGAKDLDWFEKTILTDVFESEKKMYKKHMKFWLDLE